MVVFPQKHRRQYMPSWECILLPVITVGMALTIFVQLARAKREELKYKHQEDLNRLKWDDLE
jgi:hypothetical protein